MSLRFIWLDIPFYLYICRPALLMLILILMLMLMLMLIRIPIPIPFRFWLFDIYAFLASWLALLFYSLAY